MVLAVAHGNPEILVPPEETGLGLHGGGDLLLDEDIVHVRPRD